LFFEAVVNGIVLLIFLSATSSALIFFLFVLSQPFLSIKATSSPWQLELFFYFMELYPSIDDKANQDL
jgi:hypothetical protein